ncbi:MAG TPA: hypothetical protein VN176_07315 [Verrucomicrobiae bacterium]|jgi:hypothetical protein|nr:hypothetical protein [Verrucomicrobiae bacterium]
MKNKIPWITISVLLVTLGFGQTSTPSTTDQASVKGCLGGSDGNYAVAEDGTTQTFKITTSVVDLKSHLGQDVEVVGQKTNLAVGTGSYDKTIAVTQLSMISDHCASTPLAPVTATNTAASAPVAPDTATTTAASTPSTPDTTTTTTAASTPEAHDTATTTAASSTPVADTASPASDSAAANDPQLPQTATPLPLLGALALGLLAMGFLATGLLSRRSRTN